MLRHALALAAGGVLVGGLAALGMSRLLSQMLFEVRPTDPLTYMAIAIVLGSTAALAAWWPARRAASVDPMVALRAE